MEQVVIAAIAAVPSIIAAWLGYKIKKDTRETNDAVNHRHKTHPRLYDIAIANREAIGDLQADVCDVKSRVTQLEGHTQFMIKQEYPGYDGPKSN